MKTLSEDRTTFYLSDGKNIVNYSHKWRTNSFTPLHLEKKLPQLSHSLIHDVKNGIWDSLLPLRNPEKLISLGEGNTPVIEWMWANQKILVKCEFQNPTGSYKDRGASVMLTRALEEGAQQVVEDSSGNAGCSVAAYAAAAGLSCLIFVPQNASQAKLNQIRAYGALVEIVPGTRDNATEAAYQSLNDAWFASHVWCPWFLEGTKTFAFEVWYQTKGELPEEIIYPVGNGTLILGSFIGFQELCALGILKNIPRLSASFSDNCAPLVNPEGPFKATIASGISVTKPVRRYEILKAVHQTGGKLYPVLEDEILEAWKLAARSGFYLEYTSAVPLAAALKYKEQKTRLIPLTGSGLKN